MEVPQSRTGMLRNDCCRTSSSESPAREERVFLVVVGSGGGGQVGVPLLLFFSLSLSLSLFSIPTSSISIPKSIQISPVDQSVTMVKAGKSTNPSPFINPPPDEIDH